MPSPASRLSFIQVVIVAVVSAVSVQLVQHEAPARAAAPKGKVDKKRPKVGPSDQSDPPKSPPIPATGKQSFYIRKDVSSFLGGTTAIVAVTCDDADGIAFSSSCYSPDDVRLQSERMTRWTTNELPAELSCRFFNDTNRMATIESHIFCLRFDAEE